MENILFCENCGKEHNGSYGGGRFCSPFCSSSYTGKHNIKHKKTYTCNVCGQSFLGRKDYKEHKSKCSTKFIRRKSWTCNYCNEVFDTRKLLRAHECKFKNKNGVRGYQYKETFKCKYCNIERLTTLSGIVNHEKYCKCNPNHVNRIGHKHTDDTKNKMSKSHRLSNKVGSWHTSRTFDYKGVKLDSSYELKLAESLDEYNVLWERPKFLRWELNGLTHRYFPDFYISDFNVYVDTKNDFLINNVNPKFGITDVEKVHLVELQNNVRIIILNKDQLSWPDLYEILLH